VGQATAEEVESISKHAEAMFEKYFLR
jgi:hypothetical protein